MDGWMGLVAVECLLRGYEGGRGGCQGRCTCIDSIVTSLLWMIQGGDGAGEEEEEEAAPMEVEKKGLIVHFKFKVPPSAFDPSVQCLP